MGTLEVGVATMAVGWVAGGVTTGNIRAGEDSALPVDAVGTGERGVPTVRVGSAGVSTASFGER